jgi:hypothetical protein
MVEDWFFLIFALLNFCVVLKLGNGDTQLYVHESVYIRLTIPDLVYHRFQSHNNDTNTCTDALSSHCDCVGGVLGRQAVLRDRSDSKPSLTSSIKVNTLLPWSNHRLVHEHLTEA